MNEPPQTAGEVERLTRVYHEYHSSASTQALWSHNNPGNRAIYDERKRAIQHLLSARGLLPLAGREVLEIGCAAGEVLMGLVEFGARADNLHGVDLIAKRITTARQRYPGVDFQVGNAEALAFPDAQFDLVLLYTVISSILDHGMARNVAGEVARVLKPGGSVAWYDFRYNSPRNPNVRGVSERTISTLFPGFDLRLRPVTLLPPLARRLGRATPTLYPLLARLPILCSHYIGLLTKRAEID